jgi:hypothetical protein
LIQTKQKRAGREQRNKYKPRTETSTKPEQKQEQHLTFRHAGRPADLIITFARNMDLLGEFGVSSILGQADSMITCILNWHFE